MYTSSDYLLFFLALMVTFLGLAALGAFIEWWERRRAFARYMQENRHKFRAPRRQGADYRQEWDEVLRSLGKRI